MASSLSLLVQWVRDDSGQDLIEYGLIGALVVVAGAALFPSLRSRVGEVLGQWGVTIWNAWIPPDPS